MMSKNLNDIFWQSISDNNLEKVNYLENVLKLTFKKFLKIKIYFKLTKQITKSAVVIVDNPILLPNVFNYLFKFNFNKIILLKQTNLNLDLNLYEQTI